jgi:hypothetical protein
MEFTQEFIEANGLNDDQVKAVKGFLDTEIVPTLKKTYDEEYRGKANENAEGILSGASKYAKEKLGVNIEREQGEKWADYLQRVSEAHFSSKEQELADKEKEYQDKLANFKGGEQYQQELEKLKQEKDNLLKQVAELEPLKGIDEKYNETVSKLTNMQKEVAYGSVKPNFPDTANPYEVDAKWNKFKSDVEEKYNIELIDGKPFAIDKENVHKKVELASLVANSEDISSLLKGREQRGTGAKPTDLISVEGLPFKVPKGASSTELTKIVKEHVLNEVGDITSDKYAQRFQELYLKAKQSA